MRAPRMVLSWHPLCTSAYCDLFPPHPSESSPCLCLAPCPSHSIAALTPVLDGCLKGPCQLSCLSIAAKLLLTRASWLCSLGGWQLGTLIKVDRVLAMHGIARQPALQSASAWIMLDACCSCDAHALLQVQYISLWRQKGAGLEHSVMVGWAQSVSWHCLHHCWRSQCAVFCGIFHSAVYLPAHLGGHQAAVLQTQHIQMTSLTLMLVRCTMSWKSRTGCSSI